MNRSQVRRLALTALVMIVVCGGLVESSPAACTYEVSGCTPGLVLTGGATQTRRECYHKSTLRGASGLSECPRAERSGALCYPSCLDGYAGAGPVCWQRCPDGFRDDGAYCAKPEPYGRGTGHPWQVGDAPFSLDGAQGRCEAENPQGCEQDGLIIYPKCKLGFHATGCCVCSPDCPSGMIDIGVSCQKHTYTRGTGWPMSCPGNKEQIGALCYDDCPSGWKKASVQCEEISETCRDVPVYDCPPLKQFWFKMTDGSTCFTAAQQADTEEHAKQLAQNCTGAEASAIGPDRNLDDVCGCRDESRSVSFTSGFTYCIRGKCRRCYAGEWSDASDCLNCR